MDAMDVVTDSLSERKRNVAHSLSPDSTTSEESEEEYVEAPMKVVVSCDDDFHANKSWDERKKRRMCNSARCRVRGGAVVSGLKSRLSIEKAERSAKNRREAALMKTRKKRRNVRFHADVKKHDGLVPVHRTLDSLVYTFFQSKISSSSDILNVVPVTDLHLLSACYVKLNEVMKRCKANPQKLAYILPGGGGKGSSCSFKTHYPFLRRLREIIRVTHNLLHDAAIMADKKGLKERAASDFVLNHVRKVDEESHRVVLSPASKPAPSSSASASSSSSFASTTTTAGSPKRSSNGLLVLAW